MAWLARNEHGSEVRMFPRKPERLNDMCDWICNGNYGMLVDEISGITVPVGECIEVTLEAKAVPQPTRSAELWGLWSQKHGWNHSVEPFGKSGTSPILYTSEEGAKARWNACGSQCDWQVRRYDTCPIAEPTQ